MNWRAVLLSGVLASTLSLSRVSQADAEHYRPFERSGYGYDDQCSEIIDRIELDRSKIAEITPTGRHRKALQWYKDDLRNAHRDLDRCRYGDQRAGYDPDPYYPAGDRYDPDGDTDRYDPYGGGYGGIDRDFNWKRDWPMLLGLLLPAVQ